MSRAPACLSYLVIYNPSLRAADTGTHDDDEDAHEHAQILFYTASERAVSRDRMLRQVGLARALVNFTENFAGGAHCENVHAQGKRLIMLEPEPDFWMHALLHGSFTSILSLPNGRQSLERHLERFFTVWAWKWDIESPTAFQNHMGMQVHPMSKSLMPLIDGYTTHLPPDVLAIVATQTHVVPSSTSPPVPPALLRYLMSVSPSYEAAAIGKQPTKRRSRTNVRPPGGQGANKTGSLNFLNTLSMPTMSMPSMTMPSVNMGAMDVTRWNWSGYLSFGSTKSGGTSASSIPQATGSAEKGPKTEETDSHESEGAPATSQPPSLSLDTANEPSHSTSRTDRAVTGGSMEQISPTTPTPVSTATDQLPLPAAALVTSPIETSQPHHEFGFFNAHLPVSLSFEPADSPMLIRRRVYHLSNLGFTVAVIWPNDASDVDMSGLPSGEPEGVESLVSATVRLLEQLRATVDRDATSSPPLPAQNSSQPSAATQHLLARRDETTISGSAGFDANSSVFYDTEHLLNVDLDTEEVFTRTSNPARWFIAHRASSSPTQQSSTRDPSTGDSLYLLDTRKESSLVDVDNEVATVRRRYAF
ncbi:hypothetical protein BKA62DRAFT_766240 [Auriculariales sp. MPI-PUGE-AT-0066]|nr:hypothetical protein BKA62DRAFT_766240 [Auriculariales sp. MPI-PUGE-AT-0066]